MKKLFSILISFLVLISFSNSAFAERKRATVEQVFVKNTGHIFMAIRDKTGKPVKRWWHLGHVDSKVAQAKYSAALTALASKAKVWVRVGPGPGADGAIPCGSISVGGVPSWD